MKRVLSLFIATAVLMCSASFTAYASIVEVNFLPKVDENGEWISPPQPQYKYITDMVDAEWKVEVDWTIPGIVDKTYQDPQQKNPSYMIFSGGDDVDINGFMARFVIQPGNAEDRGEIYISPDKTNWTELTDEQLTKVGPTSVTQPVPKPGWMQNDYSITNLPAGTKYVKVHLSKITHKDNKNWRARFTGFEFDFVDSLETQLQDFTFADCVDSQPMDGIMQNLNLPTSYKGTEIVWASSHPDIISNTGIIDDTKFEGYKKEGIKLTAKFVRSTHTDLFGPYLEKAFDLTILRNTKDFSDGDYIDYDMSFYPELSVLTDQPANAMATSFVLPAPYEGGSQFVWSTSNPQVAIVENNNIVNFLPSKDRAEKIDLILTATKGLTTKVKKYPMKLIRTYGDNIAFGHAKITGSSGTPELASTRVMTTYWESEATDKAPYLQYEFSENVNLTSLLLSEKGGNVKSFDVKIPDEKDKTVWNTVYSGGTIGDANRVVFPLNDINTKKIKVDFQLNDSEKPVKIYNFELFNEPITASQVILASEKLIKLPRVTKTDISLITEGVNGATISWMSNNTSAISDTGKVYRGSADKTAVLTAEISYDGESKSFTYPDITVVRDTSSGGGGGGGGSSSGGGSGSGSVLPYLPPETKPVEPSIPDLGKVDFADLDESHWAYNYVTELVKSGIVSNDSRFRPDENITREEFLKMILVASNIKLTNKNVNFKDVDKNMWYYKYVATAYELGIITGVDSKTFGIGSPIKREDMAVMSTRLMKVKKISTASQMTTYLDSADISNYATDSVNILGKMNIMNGNEKNEFLPQNNSTRAEAAKIVSLLHKAFTTTNDGR